MKNTPKEMQALFVSVTMGEKDATMEEYYGMKVLRYEKKGRLCLKVFRGNSAKPVANYYYPNAEAREEGLEVYKYTAKRNAEYKAEKKAKKASFSNESVEVGALYYSTWGYEQTNVDFYEVVGRFGKKGLTFRRVASNVTHDGYDTGKCTAAKGEYTGEEFRKVVSDPNWVRLNTYSGMYPYDGREVGWSSYH